MTQPSSWHLSKTYSIGILIGLFSSVMTGVWSAAKYDSRLENVEESKSEVSELLKHLPTLNKLADDLPSIKAMQELHEYRITQNEILNKSVHSKLDELISKVNIIETNSKVKSYSIN